MSLVAKELTALIERVQAGEDGARDELFSEVYDELRALARRRMRKERPDHTLEPTDLVHAASLRLLGDESLSWKNRRQFFGLWNRAMDQALIDHARRRGAAKRDAGVRPVSLDEDRDESPAPDDTGAIEELAEALRVLQTRKAIHGERKAAAVRFHHLAGLTHEDTAELLGIGVDTVKRDLVFARAWLGSQIGDGAA